MIRTRSSDAALRSARNRPFATRGGAADTGNPADPPPMGRPTAQIELTPEQERICDRATD